MRGLPRLPLVVWAGFDAGLRDLAAEVDGAALGLRVGDLLAGRGWRLVAAEAEGALPVRIVRSWGACPAGCVDVAPCIAWIIRAIARCISLNITAP